MRGEILKIEIKCPKCGYIQDFLVEGLFGKKSIETKKGVPPDYRAPP